MSARLLGWSLGAALLVACADDGAGSSTDTPPVDTSGTLTPSTDTPPTDTPPTTPTPSGQLHPQYPALDLATLPGAGGGASGPYEPPDLPTTTRAVTVTTAGEQARDELQSACQVAGTAVDVPDAAGRLGVLNLGNVADCDLTLGAQVIVDTLVIGSLPGPTEAPSHRIRIRGGQIGSLLVVGGSTDLVFDGVAFNNGVVASAQRSGSAIYLSPAADPAEVVDRVVVVNSFVRLVAVPEGTLGDEDGNAYLGARARNVMFANNNIVTAGNRNAWGFRISGGDNTLLVDNTVRVSFHKLVRMNDDPVDYVYVKGGTWMREATLTAGGLLLNDSFAQLSGSTTDQVYLHDPVVYLQADAPAVFGMVNEPVQAGLSWEARRIQWHAVSEDVVSAAGLQALEDGCAAGASCDYGADTHTFTYAGSVAFPADPWRDLPTFADDDPDRLPTEP